MSLNVNHGHRHFTFKVFPALAFSYQVDLWQLFMTVSGYNDNLYDCLGIHPFSANHMLTAGWGLSKTTTLS